jgi:hypothetical protein
VFLKYKPNDIQTNAFSIHVGPLWETNINAQSILYLYTTIVYCTSYLTKIDKYVTWKMQIILKKYNCEKIKTFEWIKKLENAFYAQQMLITTSKYIYFYLSHYIIQQDHSNL